MTHYKVHSNVELVLFKIRYFFFAADCFKVTFSQFEPPEEIELANQCIYVDYTYQYMYVDYRPRGAASFWCTPRSWRPWCSPWRSPTCRDPSPLGCPWCWRSRKVWTGCLNSRLKLKGDLKKARTKIFEWCFLVYFNSLEIISIKHNDNPY
jgi:hypothetical protein